MTPEQIKFKMKFNLPSMYAIRLFKNYNKEEQWIEEIAKTENTLCFACLDYKDSQLVRDLRKYYNLNKTVEGFLY